MRERRELEHRNMLEAFRLQREEVLRRQQLHKQALKNSGWGKYSYGNRNPNLNPNFNLNPNLNRNVHPNLNPNINAYPNPNLKTSHNPNPNLNLNRNPNRASPPEISSAPIHQHTE